MAGTGGARPGAGRKPKKEKYAAPINRAERQIVDKLPQLIQNLQKLADGGYERVEDEWLPAGLVTIGTGENMQLVYPYKDPDELVLVKRRVSIADQDRAANIYLADRIMGKPIQTNKNEVSGPDGDPIQVQAFDYSAAISPLKPPDPETEPTENSDSDSDSDSS